MNDYLKIEGKNYQKIYMVGDLHGCYDLLMRKLIEQQFNFKTDLLVSVGDLIDRGPQSLACLNLINETWFSCVLGNHEQMAINGLSGNKATSYSWMCNGGSWFFKLSPLEQIDAKQLIQQCENLPFIIELSVNNKKWAFAHADYPENQYEFNKKINNQQVIWNRNRIEQNDHSAIEGVDFFVFGHTPLNAITRIANRIYIDTGAVFSGNLVITRIDNI